MNDEPRLLDTNILVYAYDRSIPHRHTIARGILTEIWRSAQGLTTLQNLAEFFVVVTSKVERPLSPPLARQIIADILQSTHWMVLDRTAETVLQAVDLSHRYSVPFWDALIAATALERGILTIVTEDTRSFQRIPSLRVLNPFE